MSSAYSRLHLSFQVPATRALLKFCREHHLSGNGLERVRQCLEALEAGDITSAVRHYLAVPLGGNGCFNDWWPPVVYEHEDEEYVAAVFEALVAQRALLMRLSVPEGSSSTPVDPTS